MSRLQDLPSELLANIILFADWHCLWSSDEKWADLLALRADQSHIADLFDLLEGRCREANIPPRFQIKLLV